MKNKRIIYWGGNDQTIIPQMGACGDGQAPSGGGSGGAGSGQDAPKQPKKLGKFPSLGDLLDKLKELGPLLALGAMGLALVAGAAVLLKKNRDPEDLAGLGDLGDGLGDGGRTLGRLGLPGFGDGEEDTSGGLDIVPPMTGMSAQEIQASVPEFAGEQRIDEDGNLWIYKDPPGIWVNFGDAEPYLSATGQTREVPITADYVGEVAEVTNEDIINVRKTWSELATEVGHIGPTTVNLQTKFPNWYVEMETPQDLHTYLRIGENNRSLIINRKEDKSVNTEYPFGVIYKLYEPLPADIQPGDMIYVTKELTSPYEENVKLLDFVDESIEDVVLRNPKWDTSEASDGYFKERPTVLKNYNELTTANSQLSEIIENEIVSGSFLDSIELDGIEYDNFDNFVRFSSVEDRIVNFKRKLDKIELFQSQSNSLIGVAGSTTGEYTQSLQRKVRKIKNEFTPFESYMYFKSSSYSSGSFGIKHDNAWPKKSGTGTLLDPYVLYAVSESVATNWYSRQIISSSDYDRDNRDRLLSNIPAHIRDDERNEPFSTFINMAGEHFDNIWAYIHEISSIYDRRDGLEVGLSRDLIYHVGRSFGFYLSDGKDLVSLPEYITGAAITGSDSTYSIESATPARTISREIWKRILNNMPFFLKTRGTVRAFKGLISCYGIPSTILRVKEYGGPNPNKNKPSFQISRKFTRALEFKSGQHVSTPWVNDTNSGRKPDTIEMRFRAASGSNQTLWQAGTDIALRLVDNGSADNYGTVQFFLEGGGSADFTLSSTSLPIYDGEFYSVMVTRVSASVGDGGNHYSGSSVGQLTSDSTSQNILYNLHVGRYDSGLSRIIYKSWTSGSTSTTSHNSSYVGNETSYIGGKPTDDFGNQLSGSIMEFRFWNTALNSGSFDNHVAAPKAFDGNHPSASYTDLVLRYSLDDNFAGNRNLDVSSVIRDTSADQSYTAEGTGSGYTVGNRPHFKNVVDEQKAKVPNLGPNIRVENKIRIEQNKLMNGLSVDERSEVSAFDLAPLDSNKVGIYFSPTEVINEDIILSVADLDYDDFIGDPRDKYKRRYRQLEDIANTYWQKYNTPNNFWDYIRLIRYYDTSVFDQLRRMTPARSRASVGLLIEPNILERKKEVIGAPPNFEPANYKTSLELNIFSASADTLPMSQSIDTMAQLSQSGLYLTYSSSIDVDAQLSQSGQYLTYTASISEDIFRTPATYLLSSSMAGWGGGKEKYGYYKLELGGPEYVFSEVLQPNISGSRISEHNFERRYFYSTQASASLNNFFSSSLVRSDKQSLYQDNQMFRLVYKGSLQTKKTTLDKLDPVTVVLTSPTTLITKEGGESKLDVL